MSTAYIDTYYRRTLTSDVRYAPLQGELDVDVCIIGGGLAGLSTALELVRRGRTVAVLEQRRIAWGASGRNGGFVTSGYANGLDSIERRTGAEDAEALFRLSIEGVEIVRSNIAGLKIEGANPVPGIMKVLRHDGGDALKVFCEAHNARFGTRLESLDRNQVREQLLSPVYHQGLLDPDAFHFHPLNYARALAAEIARRGGHIFEESAALSVERASGGHEVATAAGKISARHVVFTGGGYTDGVAQRLKRAYLPIATYVLLTEPLGDLLSQSIRTRAAIADERRAGDYYRIVDEGRLLWGGRITTKTRDPRNLAAQLRHQMVVAYPQLKDLKVELAWSGLMSYARHLMPQIGRMRDGLWYATAFGGHGMNTTAIAGRVIAQGIVGESDRYRLYAPFGLDWNGGPAGIAAAQLTYWAYQAMDAWRERKRA